MAQSRVITEELHEAMKQQLLAEYSCGQGAAVLEELRLRHGRARVDLAVVDNRIHGFELKGFQSGLGWLPHQIRIYNSVLDRVTLVVGHTHLSEALDMVPEWWGIQLAVKDVDGTVVLSKVRRARANPVIDPVAVAEFLWHDEAASLLNELGLGGGVREMRRTKCEVLYKRLGEGADLDAIWERVCRQLRNPNMRVCSKSKGDWRMAMQARFVECSNNAKQASL